MSDLVLHDVEVDGRRVDVTVRDGVVARIDRVGETLVEATAWVDGRGGALLPGLWDHHVHLLAMAAAATSVDVSGELATPLLAASTRGSGWIRAVGYHESVAGELDASALDALVGDRPLRVQHRSGALWVLNSAGCRAVGLDAADRPGIERDERGRPTGRVYGDDGWLRERIGVEIPDLAAIGRSLSSVGVVGVTDMTPDTDDGGWRLIADAVGRDELSQHVVVSGGPPLTSAMPPPPLRTGPVKLYLADHALPALDAIVGWIRAAHAAGRVVAFHTVTRTSLALAVAALQVAGSDEGDRIEHGSVVPPELADDLARLRLTVVTQPAFVATRGDGYLDDVDPADRPHLYPCAGLLAGGVPVAGSTDAPYGPADPWLAMRAAIDRRTASDRVVGHRERVDAPTALRLFLGPPEQPGGPPRRIEVGAAADLCMLSVALGDALREPDASLVAATLVAGRLVHDAI